MSAKAETLATPARPLASYVVAIVLALVIGAAAGSIITRAFATDDMTTRENVVGIAPWDQQKLDAMAGRQQAETARGGRTGDRALGSGEAGRDGRIPGFGRAHGTRLGRRGGSGLAHAGPGPYRPLAVPGP